jgi:hypothetical protein
MVHHAIFLRLVILIIPIMIDQCILPTAVSHIPQLGDANTSLAVDAVSPAGDVDVRAGDAHL